MRLGEVIPRHAAGRHYTQQEPKIPPSMCLLPLGTVKYNHGETKTVKEKNKKKLAPEKPESVLDTRAISFFDANKNPRSRISPLVFLDSI